MIMAQIITLTDRKTGGTVYPVTSTKTVFDEKGVDLDTLLTLRKQETENALKGYAKKTELTGKQDQLTDSIDVKVSGTALTVTERAKRAVFDDLFLAAAGIWGKIDYTHVENGISKPYYLNELWLTYEEAVAVYEAGAIDTPYCVMNYYDKRIRTNLPIKCASFAYGSSTSLKFRVADVITNSDIEVMNVSTRRFHFCIQPEPGDSVGIKSFEGKNLRKIMGIIDCGRYTGQNGHRLIAECPVLESVSLRLINIGINLSGCPKINADSIRYMVDQRMPLNPKDIIITLHADTYAKLTAAADDPDDEWYGIIDLAAAKQITFACA